MFRNGGDELVLDYTCYETANDNDVSRIENTYGLTFLLLSRVEGELVGKLISLQADWETIAGCYPSAPFWA